MLTGVAISAAIGLVTIPLWGHLSDRFGRKPLYMAGAVFSTLFAFPFFAMVDTKETVLVYLAIILGVNIGHDLMYGPQGAYYAEMFGTRVRYSGASLGYQLASVLSGGFAPLIAAALLAANGGDPTLVAVYMVVMGVITVVATFFARETFRDDIEEARPEERRFFREGEAERQRPTRRAETVSR
jgi:MFS family permease